jgi:hypothetical protein
MLRPDLASFVLIGATVLREPVRFERWIAGQVPIMAAMMTGPIMSRRFSRTGGPGVP